MSNVIHVDFKKEREQKETLEKIKASASQRFDFIMGNPLEAIDKMIGDLKSKEAEEVMKGLER